MMGKPEATPTRYRNFNGLPFDLTANLCNRPLPVLYSRHFVAI